jgi:hypothetical protein
MQRLSVVAIAVAIAMVGGAASAASPWFSGYLNPSNNYRYYAFTDWDTPLFGSGSMPDTNVFGIAPPAYRVDGHVIFEADGSGFANVIESTGSYATLAGLTVGSVHPVSFQSANWFSNPGFPPVSDTRGDYNAQFLNVVSEQVPEPASLGMIVGAAAMLVAAVQRQRVR